MSQQQPRYTTTPDYGSEKVLFRDSPAYERCRCMNPTAETPDRYPREIHLVETAADVAAGLKRASELKTTVGIRSSGHIMNLGNLIQDGILIDTVNLNRHVDYNPVTREICFGPSSRVEELAAALGSVQRFFPHGHAPTVGSGGFMLAGGQGWFVRGWGATSQTWIERFEVVVPDGRVLIASRTENQDLFWAARGSGLGFFGVITRFWGRTIRASKMWERTFKFEIDDNSYEPLMTWTIERGRHTPKYGTDLNITIDYPEKYDPQYDSDEIPAGAKLHLNLNLLCYTDTILEARTLMSAWDAIPDAVREHLLEMKPVQRRTFEEVFARKRGFLGNHRQDKWQINSIMNEPSCPVGKLLEAIKPAMLELPTRTSSVFACFCDIVPDEKDAALSLPQDLYISTITGSVESQSKPALWDHMRDRYQRAFHVAVGQYITEIDMNNETANTRVLSDTALARFLKIREKYDPQGLFPNYKAIVRTHAKMDKLDSLAKL
ncbi:FAD-binding oxidoreductase [Aspergillus fijiensis CBS 313.89]|uniref:Oxidoreductase, FAD-binding protein n=1 Tax=Aspergillus fijiensis CBS 313.89 TaxID=1448319 RepID=A0A8G1REJ1_9EURO|nr:oxidoreductase, FAD-binding protein [Aspergillus fijiensis CBS 313.89]RAK71444.1 oxidoreductase, FAD-binding protein [Aspergillus fijiensis CBS 313.89]